MFNDPSTTDPEIETAALRLCQACEAEMQDRDRFCRRCGVRNERSASLNAEREVAAATATSPLAPVSGYRRVSGPLANAIAGGASVGISSPIARRLIQALISFPIWLIIILLSPFDAYVTARTVIKKA